MLQRLQTFLLVTIIAVFIWLIAESQSLDRDEPSVRVQLAVPEQSDLVITSARSAVGQVKLALQGSTGALDRLVRTLGGTVRLIVDAPGVYTLDLEEELSRMAPFKGSGVNIVDVDPAFIEQVVVQRRATVEDVLVRVPPPPGVKLRGQPTVEPQTVDVAVPQDALEAFEEARYVTVALDPEAVSDLGPGVHTINAPMEIDPRVGTEHAAIRPSTVALTLDVLDNTETWTVGAPGGPAPLPVHVQLPPDRIGEYRIRLADGDEFIGVTFTGPGQGIELLKQDRARATPFIALTSDDLAKGVTSASIQFRDLPPGVTATPTRATVTIAEIVNLTPGP
jgi:hypothetical protein